MPGTAPKNLTTQGGESILNLFTGDALEVLRTLPDESVQCCVTSPPYYGLRDYGIAGQIGQEATPEQYVERLVTVFREARRILRDDGTLWLNLGDSYCGGSRKTRDNDRLCPQRQMNTRPGSTGELKEKDLIGIPWMVAFALRADGWYLRQDCIWAKPNPLPESVKDRCTKSHEHVFLLAKSPRYYFDSEAIAEPVTETTLLRLSQDIENQTGSFRVPGKTNGPMKPVVTRFGSNKYGDSTDEAHRTKSGNQYIAKPMRNKRDVWTIATRPFAAAHFAVFPPELVRPCVLAGSPDGGTVIDPFCGSGTTGEVALQAGRRFVGIDINPEYIEMTRERIEPYALQTRLSDWKEAVN